MLLKIWENPGVVGVPPATFRVAGEAWTPLVRRSGFVVCNLTSSRRFVPGKGDSLELT
jgi:hypothetical protein